MWNCVIYEKYCPYIPANNYMYDSSTKGTAVNVAEHILEAITG